MVIVGDFPNVRSQEKRSVKVYACGPSSDAPKRNRFYALHSKREQGKSLDMVSSL